MRPAGCSFVGVNRDKKLEVVGRYPEEIFPRVLRAAECHEALGETSRVHPWRGGRLLFGLQRRVRLRVHA